VIGQVPFCQLCRNQLAQPAVNNIDTTKILQAAADFANQRQGMKTDGRAKLLHQGGQFVQVLPLL
jgi:hypothetical protein